jgi:hypothetical protein
MKRLFCLFKDGRLGVHEILKVVVLVRLRSLTDIMAFTIGHLAHSINQGTLTVNQRLHQLCMSRQRGRRRILILITTAHTKTEVSSHLQNA